MSNQPPVEVYEMLFKLNHDLLNEELGKNMRDINLIYEKFRRMMSALEYVEQYKTEKAREGKL
jgi:hypothetical protein